MCCRAAASRVYVESGRRLAAEPPNRIEAPFGADQSLEQGLKCLLPLLSNFATATSPGVLASCLAVIPLPPESHSAVPRSPSLMLQSVVAKVELCREAVAAVLPDYLLLQQLLHYRTPRLETKLYRTKCSAVKWRNQDLATLLPHSPKQVIAEISAGASSLSFKTKVRKLVWKEKCIKVPIYTMPPNIHTIMFIYYQQQTMKPPSESLLSRWTGALPV